VKNQASDSQDSECILLILLSFNRHKRSVQALLPVCPKVAYLWQTAFEFSTKNSLEGSRINFVQHNSDNLLHFIMQIFFQKQTKPRVRRKRTLSPDIPSGQIKIKSSTMGFSSSHRKTFCHNVSTSFFSATFILKIAISQQNLEKERSFSRWVANTTQPVIVLLLGMLKRSQGTFKSLKNK